MKRLLSNRHTLPALAATVILGAVVFSTYAHPHHAPPFNQNGFGRPQPHTPARFNRTPIHRQPPSMPQHAVGHFGKSPLSLPDMRIRQFLFAPRNQRQAIPVSPLVAAIDRNADGRITVDELSRAGEVMKELDLNNDGFIGPAELRPTRSPRKPLNFTVPRHHSRDSGMSPERPIVGVGRSGDSASPKKSQDRSKKRERSKRRTEVQSKDSE